MANAAENASKLRLGKLTPEESERLASTFRPIWELDDAPFAQGSALSAADVDALGAGAGIAPSVRNTEAQQAQAAPQPVQPQPVQAQPVQTAEPSTAVSVTTELKSFPGHVPAPNDPKVEIAIDESPPAPAPVVAQAQPQPAAATVRKPYTPPRAPPPTVKLNRDAGGSGEFVPVKKSNTGLIVAGVGVVVVIGAIFGIRAAMSNDKTQTATTASTAATTVSPEETTHIPPPPPDTIAAQAPPPPPVVTQAPVVQAPPVQAQVSNVAPPPTHVAHVEPAPTHTVHTVHSGGSHPSGGGHVSIVRDNPF
jgi:hypothetical protein